MPQSLHTIADGRRLPLLVTAALSVALHLSIFQLLPAQFGRPVQPDHDTLEIHLNAAAAAPAMPALPNAYTAPNQAPASGIRNNITNTPSNSATPSQTPPSTSPVSPQADDLNTVADAPTTPASTDIVTTSLPADEYSAAALSITQPAPPHSNTSATEPPQPIPVNLLEGLQLQTVFEQWQNPQAFNDLPYDIAVEHNPAVALTDLNTVEIIVQHDSPQGVLETRAELRERSLSHFAKLIHRWDPDVTLSNDWVSGPFHANSLINLSEDARQQPVFDGPVTLAGRQQISRRMRRSGMFRAGLETGVESIELPAAEALLQNTLEQNAARVHTVREDTTLLFSGDGRVHWQQPGSGQQGEINLASPLILLAEGRARFEVEGEVEGTVLVYSPRRITINGPLNYAGDDDWLTLMSDGTVEVAAASITGPGDLNIDAAIYAGSRFSVRRFRDSHQGTLLINGTLIAGSVSATEPRFHTRIEHDSRLLTQRAPGFPMTGTYQPADWDGQWQLADQQMVSASAPVIADAADNAEQTLAGSPAE